LASAAGYFYTVLLFEPPDTLGWVAMTGMLLLALMAYAALTFLGSTLTRSSIAAAGIGIAGLIGVGLVSALPNVAPYTPAGISGEPAMAIALGRDPGPLLAPLLVNAAFVALVAALAWLSFRRQEL
jgi:hypothetical protein